MPSPFPGMNPYLEQPTVWHDFHERLCPALAELITAQVRPDYFVKIDEHVYIHEMSHAQRGFLGRGDVTVAAWSNSPAAATAAMITAPAEIELPEVDEERISFLEIRDRDSNEVVTVLELLSPANKASGAAARAQYEAKRLAILHSTVHLVEIDLLRGGERFRMDKLPPCDYCVLVSRYQERPRAGVWPLALYDRLPVIPVPLKAPDADAQLDLRAALDRVYDAAGYEDYLYRTPPEPDLSEAEAAWAQEFLSHTRT